MERRRRVPLVWVQQPADALDAPRPTNAAERSGSPHRLDQREKVSGPGPSLLLPVHVNTPAFGIKQMTLHGTSRAAMHRADFVCLTFMFNNRILKAGSRSQPQMQRRKLNWNVSKLDIGMFLALWWRDQPPWAEYGQV